MLIFSLDTEPISDPVEYYRRLLFELTDTLDSVGHDRRLAMYRAHQYGMPVTEIARRAHAELADVQTAIDALSGEPEADEWPIASWVPRYRND